MPGAIIGSLIAALAKGKSTEDYWRLSSGTSTQIINEEEGAALGLYAFVQSGTFNAGNNNKKAERRQRANFSFYQGNGASEDEIQMMNIAFETIPEESNLDVYYEIGDTFTCLNGVHFGNEMSNGQTITYIDSDGNETQNAFRTDSEGNQIPNSETEGVSSITVNLDYFNCFAWNNGVEVKSVRDETGTASLRRGC